MLLLANLSFPVQFRRFSVIVFEAPFPHRHRTSITSKLLSPKMINLKLIYTIILIVQTPIMYYTEIKSTPFFSLGYSKFRTNGMTISISSKLGMFLSHFIPFLIALGCLIYGLKKLSPELLLPMNLVTLLYALHFLRRSLETLFIHSYSGPIDLLTALMIASLYIGNVVFSSWSFVPRGAITPTWLIVVGILVFFVGEVGNFYHHLLLKKLRIQKVQDSEKPSGEQDSEKPSDALASEKPTNEPTCKGYYLPSGGLFPVLICPHYTFEILSFLGVMITTNFDYYQLAVVFSITVYLLTRALMTKRWYIEKGFNKELVNKRYLCIPYVI